jgi:hypothetical protein
VIAVSTERYSKPNPAPLSSGQWETSRVNAFGQGPRAAAERLLWLGADRATLVSDARWLRQVSSLEVQLVSSTDQARLACSRAEPLACVVEFELGPGENGVRALEHLREAGMLAPAVMLTHTAELALATLARSRLLEAVPVFSRMDRHAQLREWLGDLQTCLSVPA